MSIVLITGFEPFADYPVNPAQEIISRLDGCALNNNSMIRTVTVPAIKDESIAVVTRAIDSLKPKAVIMLGMAPGRAGITPERIAINVNDFRIPDNADKRPIDEPVIPGGPDAYFTTLPIKAMVAAMREAGIPAGVSNSAGTFVCNHLFYGVMHHLRNSTIGADFIHIPLLPELATEDCQPSMALDTMIKGIVVAGEIALNGEVDIQAEGGQIC